MPEKAHLKSVQTSEPKKIVDLSFSNSPQKAVCVNKEESASSSRASLQPTNRFAGKTRDEVIRVLTIPKEPEKYVTFLIRNLPFRPISELRAAVEALGVERNSLRELSFLGPNLAEVHVLVNAQASFIQTVQDLGAFIEELRSISEQVAPADLHRKATRKAMRESAGSEEIAVRLSFALRWSNLAKQSPIITLRRHLANLKSQLADLPKITIRYTSISRRESADMVVERCVEEKEAAAAMVDLVMEECAPEVAPLLQ